MLYWLGNPMVLLRRHMIRIVTSLLAVAGFLFARPTGAMPPGFKALPAFRPPSVFARAPLGELPATNRLTLALGLPLHHRDQLKNLIDQLYDPHSTNFHRFLSPADFASRFGPTPAEYQAVVQFAEAHGLVVVHQHPNRLVLDVAGAASDVSRAFQVHLHNYRHPSESRNFFAPDADPVVPTNLPVADVWGLTDYNRPHPQVTPGAACGISVKGLGGSSPNGLYEGADFRNAYVPGTPLNGAGQTVALVEFDGYYPSDIAAYESQCGYAPVPLQNIYLDSASGAPGYSQINNAVLEVSLDIEMAIAMAPGLAQVQVYEGYSPYDVYNAIATDDQARQISSSWIVEVGPSTDWTDSGGTLDSILSEMVVQGQSFFQAAGDNDAYTGSQILNGDGGPIPVDSPYVISVGGTSLNMNGRAASYASESAWNWGNNTGTGGGVSTNYSIPSWQAAVDMTTNLGSPVYRNLPDVALTADGIDVLFDNGGSSFVGGTSCAAPLWAGFCALINQQSVGTTPGGLGAGFLNPAIYLIGSGTNYAACFNDITQGNNVGANTPGLYPAVPGYDLCTGWGTPNGTNLINTLVPLALPFFIAQPAAAAAPVGSNVLFAANVSGAGPIGLQWQFNGVNLSDTDTISGSGSNVLSLAAVNLDNVGSYTLVLTNAYGAVTSSIAMLAVGFPPSLATSTLTNETVECGSNEMSFAVTLAGTPPLTLQWSLDGVAVDSATNLSFALTNLVSPNHLVSVVVTSPYGSVTNSALITVQDSLPPVVDLSPLSQTNVVGGTVSFSVAATACSSESWQWLFNAAPLPGATNETLTLSNLSLALAGNYSVLVTSAGGAATSTVATLTVDLIPAVGTLVSSGNPSGFNDPVSFTVGVVPAAASGTVEFYTNGVAFDGEVIAAGQAVSAGVSALPRGTNLITAVYSGDASDLPFTNIFAQVVTNHPPSALPAAFNRAAGTSLHIPVSQLATGWSDVDGDTVSLASVITSTNGVTVTNNGSGLLSYFNSNNVPDQFDCIITDGFGGTNYQAVNISVVFPGITAMPGQNSSGIVMSLTGVAGQTYVLQTTTNLMWPVVWLPVATNTLVTTNVWQFTDPGYANYPQRFYRLSSAN